MVDGVADPVAPGIRRELGGYRLLGQLGGGGMGIVYLAEHTLVGRRAAIKTIKPEIAAIPAFERRFVLEAKAIAGLDHPSIVKLYDFAFADGSPYMVMEYLTGRTLEEELLERGRLSPELTLERLGPVASALDHAHDHGVVHRDVKPANILIADDGRTLVMDFGLACLDGYTMATDPDSFLGTPDYVAPEQITNQSVDGEADVYSLAAVIFECVTGRKPFTGKSWIEVASKRLTEPAPLATEVPPGFALELARGMSKEAHQRQSTAGELLESLARALIPVPEEACPDEGQQPESRSQLSAQDNLTDAVGTLAVGLTAACLATLVTINELLVMGTPMALFSAHLARSLLGH